MAITSRKLYDEFAWGIYRHLHCGDPHFRKRYLVVEIYMTFSHLKFFFLLGYWMQQLPVTIAIVQKIIENASLPPEVAKNGVSQADTAYCILVPVALTLSVTQMSIASFSVSREARTIQLAIITMLLGSLAAVAFTAFMDYSRLGGFNVANGVEYGDDGSRLVVYTAFALLVLVLTVVLSIGILRSFGSGLKPYLQDDEAMASAVLGRWDGAAGDVAMMSLRMDID